MTPYSLVDRYSFTLKVEAVDYIRTLGGLPVYKTTWNHISQSEGYNLSIYCSEDLNSLFVYLPLSTNGLCWKWPNASKPHAGHHWSPKDFTRIFYKLPSHKVIFVTLRTVCSSTVQKILCMTGIWIYCIFMVLIFFSELEAWLEIIQMTKLR
jgi:hypothetical protein